MKALILSSNTGGGHNSCARALQEALMARGIPCDIRDGLSFLSKEAPRFISQWHVRFYRNMPRLYGEGYSLAEKHAHNMDDESLVYRLLGFGAKSLRACIVSQGYTIVVCTHLFPGMMLTQLQRRNPLPIVTGFISTDYTASPGYEAIDLDWCFVPAPEIVGDFIKANMPAERVVSCGMPVCPEYLTPADRDAAKRALGIDPSHRHLLVMSGSMGCGPIKRIVRQFARTADEAVEISVLCGTNRKLARQLSQKFADCANIHIHDFVERVSLFMDSADLYLTKPGGLGVSEAMAKRLPMVLLQAVNGCETHNLRYCLKKGVAVTAEDPDDIPPLCLRLIHDDAALDAMRLPPAEKSAADAVCDCLLNNEG